MTRMYSRISRSTLLAVSALVFVGSLPTIARAQSATEPASEQKIEKITVTATKRSAKVQDTSAAITVLKGTDIEERGAEKTEDLQYQVPGLIYGETSGTSQVSIRGVGLSVETGFAEQGVASYIDGVFLPRGGMTNLNFGDIGQVEVLRGPQGTLYGRNATGGVISYITRKPTEEFEAGFKAGYAEFNTYRGEAMVSGPIGNGVLGRLFVTSSDTEGYLDNPLGIPVGDEHLDAGRASLRLLASKDFTIDLSAMYLQRDGGYVHNQVITAFGPLYGILPAASTKPNTVTTEIDPNTEHEVYGGIVTLAYDFGDGVVGKSITSFLQETRDEYSDSDGVPIAITYLDRFETSKSKSQEFNFNGTGFGGSLDWVFGLYYFQEEASLNADVDFFGLPLRLFQGLDEDNTTYGVFTDLTVSVSENVRLLGGLRYGRDEKDIHYRYDSIAIGGPACTGAVQVNLDSLNPKAGVEIDAADDVMLYAQYTRGTKPGGANLSSPTCDDTFDDEKIDAYEIGAKTAFADEKLIINGSAFYYAYEDYQVFQINFPSASIVNAPESTVKGVELELIAKPHDDFAINLGMMYLDAQYDRFTDIDSFGIVCLIPGQCPTIPYLPSPLPQDLSGNKLTRSPEWTFNLGIENKWNLGEGVLGSLKLRGELYYVDDMFFRQFNEAWDHQDGYLLGNAFVTLASSDEKWALRGYVKNIGDEAYIVSQFSNASPLGNASTLGIYGPPRTIGIELSARFGG